MPHPLDGALIRVWTAEEHINDLAERIDDLARSHADAAIDKLDLNGLNLSHEFIHEGKWLGAADKMIFDTIQTPILFPAIVGEVCYHLRAGSTILSTNWRATIPVSPDTEHNSLSNSVH